MMKQLCLSSMVVIKSTLNLFHEGSDRFLQVTQIITQVILISPQIVLISTQLISQHHTCIKQISNTQAMIGRKYCIVYTSMVVGYVPNAVIQWY